MKLHKITTIGVLALVLVLGVSIARAEEGRSSPKPPIKAENRQGEQGKALNKLAEERKEKENKQEDRDERNRLSFASTTVASTTNKMFKRDLKTIEKDLKKKMEKKQFEERKAALIRELTKALERLNEIVVRIETHISKAEESGRNMTEPKALLVTAKQKVAKATADVNALKNLVATSTPSTGTATSTATTTEVDLTKPRQVGDAAIKSVKEARDALQKVVVSIAHNMGLGKTKTATSTPPTTGTTTPPVATTTPPTATSTATTTNQ